MRHENVIRVCDLDHKGKDEPAQPVEIATVGGTFTLDVCERHAARFLSPLTEDARLDKRRRLKP